MRSSVRALPLQLPFQPSLQLSPLTHKHGRRSHQCSFICVLWSLLFLKTQQSYNFETRFLLPIMSAYIHSTGARLASSRITKTLSCVPHGPARSFKQRHINRLPKTSRMLLLIHACIVHGCMRCTRSDARTLVSSWRHN